MHIDIRLQDPEALPRIEQELGESIANPVMVIGYYNLDEDKKELGCFLTAYSNYTKNYDIEGTCIAKGKWFHPSIYEHLFQFVFGTLQCKRFTFRISNENTKCIELAERAGAVKECALRGTDMLLYSILPQECQFYVKR